MESKDQNKNLILGITKIGDLLLEQVISKNEEDKSLYSIVLAIRYICSCELMIRSPSSCFVIAVLSLRCYYKQSRIS